MEEQSTQPNLTAIREVKTKINIKVVILTNKFSQYI